MNTQAAQDNNIETEEEARAYRAQLIADDGQEDAGTLTPEALEPEPAPLPADPPATPATENAWEGVNPALKTMFDDMSGKVASLETTEYRLKQAESRIGALTNELSTAKAAASELSNAPSTTEMAGASGSLEKWEELKTDYPEWGEALEERLSAVSGSGISKEQMEAQIVELRSSMEGETERKIELAVLGFAHPDYQETIDSKPYQEWLATQPAEVVANAKSSVAREAIGVLDAFAETTSPAPAPTVSAAEIARQRRNRLRTATTPAGQSPVPVKSEADLTDAEYRAEYGKKVFAEK